MWFSNFFQWLSDTPFSAAMRESTWGEPIVETIHVSRFFPRNQRRSSIPAKIREPTNASSFRLVRGNQAFMLELPKPCETREDRARRFARG